jgi:hypothetical protein
MTRGGALTLWSVDLARPRHLYTLQQTFDQRASMTRITEYVPQLTSGESGMWGGLARGAGSEGVQGAFPLQSRK